MPETTPDRHYITLRALFLTFSASSHSRSAMQKKNDSSAIRLNKAIAHSGVSSRRAADVLIQESRVSVNGFIVSEPGTRVDPAVDIIIVDGKKLVFETTQEHLYLVLNKPVHVVSTTRDPEGRKNVLDLLPPQYAQKRLYPVGRLDYFSEGLLLLTDDGDLTLRLTHPRYQHSKTYHVRLREKPSPDALNAMRSGMTLAEGEKLEPVKARLLETRDVVLEMTLTQGLNRQIRRMCRDLGLVVLRLVRVSSGPLLLGDLPSGKVRRLTEAEVAALKKSAGLQKVD